MLTLLNIVRIFFLFLFFCFLYPFIGNKSLYFLLKSLGASFVKLGQILSSRPDIVGSKISLTLSSFQDNLGSFSKRKVRKILDKEFGKKFDDIFSDFNFTACASASIAQVHKARLKNNQNVAVKILRPNIKNTLSIDISSIKLISRILKLFSKNLSKIVFDIAMLLEKCVESELDLLQEASNASKLKENLRDIKNFYIPQIFWQFSTSKILVIEWLDGIAFSNKKEIDKISAEDKKNIAANLVNSYFHQVYVDGFFHADMHQGNLFLLQDNKIGLVDFGIVGMIDGKTRIAIAEILIGFLNKDYDMVARSHVKAGLVAKDVNLQELSLSCRKIGEIVVGVDVKEISIAKLFSNVISMTKKYNISTKPEFLLLQKTMLLIEGVGMDLDPNLNMWNLARPWAKEWSKSNIGFDAKIRDSILTFFHFVKDILIKN